MDAAERAAWRRADEILCELLERVPGDRAAALAALEPPAEVRQRVEALLLAAGEAEGGLLDAPVPWPAGGCAGAEPLPPLVGRRVGPYVLDEEIGRGGMAVVYAGHRADGAFAQEVAVKLLGIGLLAVGGGERFRREQQVLARLRHPRIATLLDGGIAEDGTPWLAMELLRGQAIDDWCAARGTTARERVALLLQVCEAVAFAHRNLVVHRDLKPSNVLVDEGGQVKLLDFGIAGLLDAPAGEDRLTGVAVRFLTPGYAAPEQVDGDDVTTATDTFALGRILEHLLDVPPAVVDADLRNIARQAVRAEPGLRYADAADLAADLERWRSGRPVSATGNALSYRLRKALRRHRAALAAVTVILAVATGGLAATLWQAERARQQERTANTVNAFLVDLFHASDPERAQGEDPRASELLRRGAERARARLAGEPALEAQLLHVIGSIQREVGQAAAGESSLARALELRSRHLAADDPQLAATRVQLGLTRYELGRVDDAITLLRAALADLERALPPHSRDRLDAEVRLGDMLVVQGEYEEAQRRMESVLARIGPATGELAELALDAEYTLAVALGELGEVDAADRRLRAVIASERQRHQGFSRDLALYLNEYGLLRHDVPDYPAAEAAYREALAIKRRLYGEAHPQVAAQLLNLGMVLNEQGRREEGLAVLEDALAVSRRLYPQPHPELAKALESVGTARNSLGRATDALAPLAEAVAIWRLLPADAAEPADAGNCLRNYGIALLAAGNAAAAVPVLQEAVARYAASERVDPVRAGLSQGKLGEALVALGRAEDGLPHLEAALAVLEPSFYSWDQPGFVALALAAAQAEAEAGRVGAARRRLATIGAHLERASGSEWQPVKVRWRTLAAEPAAGVALR